MPENCQLVSDSGVTKSGKSFADLFILGILAGAYIALAAAGSSMIAFNLLSNPETYGLGRCLAGFIFPCGLILVVLAGAELFTGNVMMLLPMTQRRISLFGLLRNWMIVYASNFIGAVFVAFLIYHSGHLNAGNRMLESVTIGIATSKCSLNFTAAFALGIICNWLVCLAVWMAIGAKETAGKILAMFFPVWLFVALGSEHSIANMYYIPIGLLAAQAPWSGEPLSWANFFTANLLPVTLGNIVGGGVLVALAYGCVHRK
ncbi:MAG: formate/nitrite transporter family protein [Planctomycetaceae bacterium]|jgi:formate/nitrite transporter|nr:formate/nitrite transporter family protein [Planctomycetaceae bacterium]